ncbi:MAG: peptidylprolyl isomerase [Gemmatimonadaceae bacterium]|nr:peptidylprolyl isomerase [Gemmatimonadaceae bacterium]
MTKVIGFHYTLRDEDGQVLDSSSGGDPLYFIEGRQQIIPGLERELLLLEDGDKRHIAVSAADAYGDVNPELVAQVKRSQFPPDATLEIGDQFTVEAEGAGPVFTIVDVDAEHVTVDGNHPMAGKALMFEIEIVGLRDALADELSHGHVHGPEGHEH